MSHGGRRPKKHHEEEHVNHERWLVSYADMVTLLMCLFIVLFAISQVDKDKYAALTNGLQQGFGAPMSVLDDGTAAAGQPTISFAAPVPVDIKGDTNPKKASSKSAQQIAVETEERRKGRVRAEAKATVSTLSGVREKIDRALRKSGHPGSAQYRITDRGLVVSIIADQVLFDSARADLRPEGAEILRAVAPTLRSLPNDLSVEGHTNHLQLLPGTRWPSDWELSAYRATTVLRYLNGQRVPEKRMFAAGFADTQPLISPSLPQAVTQNRRVDIVVLSDGSAESNELLAEVARSSSKNFH